MPVTTALMAILAAFVGSGLLYQVLGSRRDTRRNLPPGQLVPVNRHRLHLWVLGDKDPTVVLEAGIGASSLSWRLVHTAAARFARVCAYDRAGLGWSEAGRGGRSAHRSVAELRRALSGAGLPPPYVLVGHSFGAYLVRVFAALHPAEVAGMVLVDPLEPQDWQEGTPAARRRLGGGVFYARLAAGLAVFGVVRLAINRFLRGDRQMPRAVLSSFPREATPVVEGLVRQIAKLPAEYWPAIQAHWTRTRSFWTLAQYLAALPGCAQEVIAAEAARTPPAPMAARRGPRWEIPVVVLSAATASPSSLARHRATAACSPCGQHRTVSSSGHWLQLDAPTDVVEAIQTVVNVAQRGRPAEPEVNEHEGTG